MPNTTKQLTAPELLRSCAAEKETYAANPRVECLGFSEVPRQDAARLRVLAGALETLREAVKGCGHGCVTGPRYGGCGTVVEGRRMLCYFCARKRDAAVDFLLDGRTTT